jgi:hypothetical protein
MTPNPTISHIVMRRVRVIHAVRTLSIPVSSGLALLLALWGIGREVWVAKVFENMPAVADMPAVLSFFASAFLHTDFAVQVFSILAAASVAWLAYGIARTLRASAAFA